MNEFPSFDQVLNAQNYTVQLQIQHWLKYELHTPQACLLISMLILPWLVWWPLVDKRRFMEIIIYGLLVCTVATVLDEIGSQLNWWEYRYDIEPLFPRLIPMNFSMLPVAYMLVYQYFPRWKPFVAVNTVASALYAFVGEPLFAKTGIYVMLNWHHLYSFPIYISLAVLCKLVIKWVTRVQAHVVAPRN